MATDSTAERASDAAPAVSGTADDPRGALGRAHVLVVGAAGVGAAVAGHLAAAGAGHLAIMDGAPVEARIIARQLLHFTPDIGANRAESLTAKLGFLNPAVHADSYPAMIDEANAAAVVEGHDLVIDCSGPGGPGLLLNDACVAGGVPLVQAALSERHGTLTIVEPGRGPCLLCARDAIGAAGERAASEAPPALPGALAGLLGAAAAGVAAGLLDRRPGLPEPGTVLVVTGRPAVIEVPVALDPHCPACGHTDAGDGGARS